MATVDFKGKSGKKYTFDVCDIDTEWNDGISAIYIVTKRYKNSDKKFSHTKIYIGRTEDLKERHSNHHKEDCFVKNNANCICIYQEEDSQKLIDIETDLIQGSNTPCNDI